MSRYRTLLIAPAEAVDALPNGADAGGDQRVTSVAGGGAAKGVKMAQLRGATALTTEEPSREGVERWLEPRRRSLPAGASGVSRI
jgi:hypothetical protein